MPRNGKQLLIRPGNKALDVSCATLLAGCAVWCFATTLARMIAVWRSEPDYEHGFLVPFIALAMLWARRAKRPAAARDWRALPVAIAALVLWLAGGMFYLRVLEEVGFLLWIAAACGLLAGGAVLRWAAPALGFLIFMVPAPYRVEQLLTLPLQRIATVWSCWLLQCCGLPALAEGNLVIVDDLRLEVAQACSGLRLFMCVLALAYLYAVFSTGPRWMKWTLFLCAAPVALAANTLRLTATALAWKCVSSEHGRELLHDAAGWLMIPLAAALLLAVLWYLRRITIAVEVVDATRLLRHAAHANSFAYASGGKE